MRQPRRRVGDRAGIVGAANMAIEHVLAPEAIERVLAPEAIDRALRAAA